MELSQIGSIAGLRSEIRVTQRGQLLHLEASCMFIVLIRHQTTNQIIQ